MVLSLIRKQILGIKLNKREKLFGVFLFLLCNNIGNLMFFMIIVMYYLKM